MISPGNRSFNLFEKAFSEVRKSTMQTPFLVEATKIFFKNGESKKA
jgi:hypothetical protein